MFIEDRYTNEFGERDIESPDERILYAYVASLAKLQPDISLHKHRLLLTEANAQGNREVEEAWQRILMDKKWERNGKLILNRCFYGLRNRWLVMEDRKDALRELIISAKQNAPYGEANSPHLRRLRYALNAYVTSEQYEALEWNLRLPEVETLCSPDERSAERQTLRDRFRDQFYLHEVLTATPDIPLKERKALRKTVSKQARLINRQLYSYLETGEAPRGIIRYREFGSRKTFDDCLQLLRPDREGSIQEVASQFANRVRRISIDDFCQEIYQFVLEPLGRANKRFNPARMGRLQAQIREEIGRGREEGRNNQFNEISVTAICSHLLKLLVVESLQRSSAINFQKLLTHVGHATLTEVLMRIVLFWPKVRYVLEERFGILLHVHRSKTREEIPWLARALEYMKIGLAFNGDALNYFDAKAVAQH